MKEQTKSTDCKPPIYATINVREGTPEHDMVTKIAEALTQKNIKCSFSSAGNCLIASCGEKFLSDLKAKLGK